MRLKEKTHRKFVEYFERMTKMYQGKEFELAYSVIQKETGTASVTLKRAIQELLEDHIITVKPGRNSRYALFQYIPGLQNETVNEVNASTAGTDAGHSALGQTDSHGPENYHISEQGVVEEVQELIQLVDNLRRRIRTQEMSIAILQDRVSELEDKVNRR